MVSTVMVDRCLGLKLTFRGCLTAGSTLHFWPQGSLFPCEGNTTTSVKNDSGLPSTVIYPGTVPLTAWSTDGRLDSLSLPNMQHGLVS